MCEITVLEGKNITLKRMVDGTLRLGQPYEFGISVTKGDKHYGRDKGKYIVRIELKGSGDKVSLVLDEQDIKSLTICMWNEYLENERERAIKDLKDIFPIL